MRCKQELVSIASIPVAGPLRSPALGHSAVRRNRRTFTLADQVNRLVGASEADPDRGFLGRTMALCSLPRTNPGNQLQYERRNGPFTLGMIAGPGTLPRSFVVFAPQWSLHVGDDCGP